MLYVMMGNPGGELDRRQVKDEEEAKRVLLEMIEDLPGLAEGDTFTLIDEDEDEEN